MSHLSIFNFFRLIVWLWWTSNTVLGHELNSYQDINHHEGELEPSYFFYQHPDYPRDCTEVRKKCPTSNPSGVYFIKPDGYPEPFEVYCDNTTDSGGWTLIQRLHNGSTLFNRNWKEYKTGFGFISQEFWLGNDKVSFLTNQKAYELRIDITSADGLSFYVTYNSFRISDEYSGYLLTSVGEYKGTQDKIDMFLCPPYTEGVVYTSANCSIGCSCISGQFTCDHDYKCSPNAVCEERSNVLQCYCDEGYTGDGVNCSPVIDCQDIYDRVSNESGVYKIKPTTWQGEPFDVYCNMTDGGGWTVFQRRVDGFQNFFLNWTDYKDGFGTADHELWLGNDKLHSLTTQNRYELRIDLLDNLGDSYYAKHSSFSISDENDNYRLSLGNYSEGDTGDQLSYNNGLSFTTRDRDNDNWGSNNCVNRVGNCDGSCTNNGAWWYNDYSRCSYVHLNSPYGSKCFRWHGLSGKDCNIKYAEMKVRPI